MLIHGTPLNPELLKDADAKDRFWYWRGASGRRYIHSVYPADRCPPLPGATYVLVRRTGTLRTAIEAGCFSEWGGGLPAGLREEGCELHVHLLARDGRERDGVLADLSAALRAPEAGFAEEAVLAA